MVSVRPSASPGGRAPHLWLGEDTSLFDLFGFEFTLLRLGSHAPSGDTFVTAAATLGIPLKVLDVKSEEVRALYQADLALIRPDQIVAWRGNEPSEPMGILGRVAGHVHHCYECTSMPRLEEFR